MGWKTRRNGDLSRNAVPSGCHPLISFDQGVRFEQDLVRQPITLPTITTDD